VKDYVIAFVIGVALVLVTAVITHFVIGRFTEATGIVGVLAAVFYARHVAEKQSQKEGANG
jgi:hypothetical protein